MMSGVLALVACRLSRDEVATFERDGAVVVRGLVRGELLQRVLEARHSVQNSLPNNEYASLAFGAWQGHSALEELALRSTVTDAARQLLGRDDVHLLLDAFFELRSGQQGCGWHVDDKFFWPCEGDDGLNVWIALDAVGHDGGGLAFAPGTHLADFDDVRETIKTPVDGAAATCQLAELNPAQNARVEARKQVPLMNPGDAIIHKRNLFHRAVPFTTTTTTATDEKSIARFSARYVPSDAVLDGFTLTEDGKVAALPNARIDTVPHRFPRVRGSSSSS